MEPKLVEIVVKLCKIVSEVFEKTFTVIALDFASPVVEEDYIVPIFL